MADGKSIDANSNDLERAFVECVPWTLTNLAAWVKWQLQTLWNGQTEGLNDGQTSAAAG